MTTCSRPAQQVAEKNKTNKNKQNYDFIILLTAFFESSQNNDLDYVIKEI